VTLTPAETYNVEMGRLQAAWVQGFVEGLMRAGLSKQEAFELVSRILRFEIKQYVGVAPPTAEVVP
jgi:hypothetical protein